MDFYQENDVWQDILAETNPHEQCRKAVEFAKLLLESVTPGQAELETWNPDELTDLLREYRRAGEKIREFLVQARPRLDLEEGEQSFAELLQSLQEGLARLSKEYARIEQQRREWQEETRRVETETRRKETLQRETLEEQTRHAEAEAQRLQAAQAKVNEMEQHLRALEDTLRQLAGAPAQLQQLAERAGQRQSEAVGVVLEAVSRVVELLRQLRDAYQTHGAEDQRLAQAFIHLPAIEGFAAPAEELRQLSGELDTRLQRFDALLRGLVETLEKQQKSLRQRREQ